MCTTTVCYVSRLHVTRMFTGLLSCITTSCISNRGSQPTPELRTCYHHAEVVQQLERRIGRAMLRQQARVAGGQGGPPLRGSPGSACWPRCCDMLEHQGNSLVSPGAENTVSRIPKCCMLQQACTALVTFDAAALCDLSSLQVLSSKCYRLQRNAQMRHVTITYVLQRLAVCYLTFKCPACHITDVAKTWPKHVATTVASRWHVRCGPVQTWRTVAAAVLVTLSEFFGSASSRKHSPRTAATPSCAERKLLHMVAVQATRHW